MARRVLVRLTIVALLFLGLALACRSSEDDGANGVAAPTLTPGATVPEAPTVPPFATVPTEDADDAGRADCPSDWLVYVDPNDRYSICYPRDARVTSSDLALNVRSYEPASAERDGFTVVVAWSDAPSLTLAADGEPDCRGPFVMAQAGSFATQMRVGGQDRPACLAHGTTEGGIPVGSLIGDVALGEGGYLNVRLDFGGPGVPDVPALAQRILETLVAGVR